MKFKKLNEALTDTQIYENLQEYIYNKLESVVDNLAIQAASDVEGYNPDWCTDNVSSGAYTYLRRAAEYFADELMRYAPHGEIIESLNEDVDASQFIGKPLKDFLKTIDHRTKISLESENGYDDYGGVGKIGGLSGLAHDAQWYLADKIVKDIQEPSEDKKRFYEYKILIENYEKKDELDESIPEKKLYADAEDIADRISEFLDETSRIDNISDYLDEDDFEHIGKTQDALYYFAREYSKVNESLLTEKKWDYQLKNGVALRNAIDAEDYGQIKNSLIAAYKEIHEVMPEKFDEYDLENKLEDLEYLDTEPDEDIEISEDDIRENFDYELNDLYDLCDNLNIWVSLSN